MNEEVMDLVEETINDTNSVGSDYIRAGLVGLFGGIAIGVAVGYTIAKKRLQPKYEQLAQQEIAEARAFFNKLSKETMVSVRPSMEDATEALRTYRGESNEESDEPNVDVIVETNIFVAHETEGEWDQEKEDLIRHNLPAGSPYIINHDEYMSNETEYEQSTLTYYEGDFTLADERDEPIPLIDDTVGEDNIRQFGHGSGDSNTIFIRNDRLKMEFEVVKSDGKFAHEVLGLQHSDQRERHERGNKIHKFRGGDE